METLSKVTEDKNNIIETKEETDENILSLSDDEEEDKLTTLTDKQWEKLKSDGYCELDDPIKDEMIVNIVSGYIRSNFSDDCMIIALIRIIINFYNARYNTDLYIELLLKDTNSTDVLQYLLVPKVNISLSGLLSRCVDANGNQIEIEKVNIDVMHHVLRYLGHHKGKEPESIAKPIRSTRMERIVADKWDADFVNALSKKAVFQLILAANYLDCPSLMHLGSAKIAILIKGKSPEEIKNILADDSKQDTEEKNDERKDDEKKPTPGNNTDDTTNDNANDANVDEKAEPQTENANENENESNQNNDNNQDNDVDNDRRNENLQDVE